MILRTPQGEAPSPFPRLTQFNSLCARPATRRAGCSSSNALSSFYELIYADAVVIAMGDEEQGRQIAAGRGDAGDVEDARVSLRRQSEALRSANMLISPNEPSGDAFRRFLIPRRPLGYGSGGMETC